MSSVLPTFSDDVLARARRVRLLALDSDGVLTDGGVYIDDNGQEFRRFNIKDGLGLKQVMAAGIQVAIISGADTTPVLHRAEKLGISEVYVGVADKLASLLEICSRLKITFNQVAYMGDDLPDLPVLEQVELPCAPSDAYPDVLKAVVFVTRQPGGYGAVRELADLLLATR